MPHAPFDTGLPPDELDLERPSPIETPWGRFAVFKVEGGLVAVDCWCPHMQGPLFEGTRSGGELTCPWHGWRYALVNGDCTWSPNKEGRESRVRTLPVEVGRGGTVLLGPPEG